MRPKRKAEPITLRLYIDEMERVKSVYENFKKRYPFAELSHMIRIWLGLKVEDPSAVLSPEERDYLTGRIPSLPESGTLEGQHGPFLSDIVPVPGRNVVRPVKRKKIRFGD